MVGGGGELVVRYGTSMVRRVMVIAALVASCAQKSVEVPFVGVVVQFACDGPPIAGIEVPFIGVVVLSVGVDHQCVGLGR